jgi:para-nitrobenzyl esterase
MIKLKKLSLKCLRLWNASDIEYALGNLATNKVYNWTQDDYSVSDLTLNYFANFIKTGNPNGAGVTEWPRNREGGDMMLMDINTQSKSYREPNRSRYLFLDSFYRNKK